MKLLPMQVKLTGEMTMKTNKMIFIYQNLHDIINFIKQNKIKHGPMNKVLHYNKNYGHACEIYDFDQIILLYLAFNESIYCLKDTEKLMSFSKNRKAIILDSGG